METPSELEDAAFSIGYVALQVERPGPEYLKHGWSLVEAGPYWRVWTRSEALSKPATSAGTARQ